jgi:HSP20 family protein
MNIVRWEPFREMEDFLRQYTPTLHRPLHSAGAEGDWKPAANITETDKEFVIRADLPEVKKEDIKVTAEDGMITVSGERKREREEKNANEIRVETFYGTFTRSFALPDNVDTRAIQADSKDGVLRVRIPKTEIPKVKQTQIEVK